MEKIDIKKIDWRAPEYKHKERNMDFFWTIGLVAIVGCIIAIWLGNYVFAIFIIASGGCLILFTFRKPEDIDFGISNDGVKFGNEIRPWDKIKSFDIKQGDPYAKLMVETTRSFLPIFTIPLPKDLMDDVEIEFSKVVSQKEIAESQSMQFAEKIGL